MLELLNYEPFIIDDAQCWKKFVYGDLPAISSDVCCYSITFAKLCRQVLI